MKIYYLLILLYLFTGCVKSKVESNLEGTWIVDEVNYKNNNVLRCFASNYMRISLKKEDSYLPVSEGCPLINGSRNDVRATIEISKSENDTIPYNLNIRTTNKIFRGKHKMVLHNDIHRKALVLEIFSDSLSILCTKIRFNYDEKQSLLKYLEDATWPSHPQQK